MTKDEFNQSINFIFDKYKTSNILDKEELCYITTNPKEDLDSDTYLKVLYLWGKDYEMSKNPNGARFCGLRMMLVIQACSGLAKKPRHLELINLTQDKDILDYVSKWCDFLNETNSFIRKRLFILSIVVGIISGILLILNKVTILFVCIFTITITILINLIFYNRVRKKFYKKQVNALFEFVDEALIEFDRPVYHS
ncbi:MAG: hypothetical protein RSC93_04400 [Erysipelotrichaceae bacterium]